MQKKTLFHHFNIQSKCVFIHVPKTAGSSIEMALFQTRGEVGHKPALEYIVENKFRFEQYFSFAFVRNPYDRFVSAYAYLRKGGRNKFDRAWANQHLDSYDSFSSFVSSLRNSKIRATVLNWIHFIPQYKFTCDENENILIDYIGKYESLEADFHDLSTRIYPGRSIQLPHHNGSDRTNHENYFNDESRALIREIYSKDFQLFGYE